MFFFVYQLFFFPSFFAISSVFFFCYFQSVKGFLTGFLTFRFLHCWNGTLQKRNVSQPLFCLKAGKINKYYCSVSFLLLSYQTLNQHLRSPKRESGRSPNRCPLIFFLSTLNYLELLWLIIIIKIYYYN